MTSSSASPAGTFWDQLQADVANFGEMQLWRVGMFMVIGAALGLYIRLLYDRFGHTAADSDSVARVFPLLVLVTTCVIAVIKSSLALSLGLVGALSIVRFRAAIKDPEELVYLFLCIGVGLCLGAEQPALALLMTAVGSALVIGGHAFGRGSRRHNVVLTITGDATRFADSDEGVLAVVRNVFGRPSIQRYDVDRDEGQLRVFIRRIRPEDATALVQDLRQQLPDCGISYVNTDGLR